MQHATGETQPMLAQYNNSPGVQGVQQVTRRFGGAWRFLFFTAACTAVAGGVVGFLETLEQMQNVFQAVTQIYLILFGLILVVLDMPDIQMTQGIIFVTKFAINKYALIVTRFTGRGFMYLFLSAMVVGCLWVGDDAPFLGFILGGYLVAIGLLAIYKGIAKSLKLDRVRRNIKTSCAQRGKEYINMICPGSGLTGEQFSELIVQMQGEKFTEEEMSYVMNALSMKIKSVMVVHRNEFLAWTHQAHMTIL